MPGRLISLYMLTNIKDKVGSILDVTRRSAILKLGKAQVNLNDENWPGADIGNKFGYVQILC